MPTNSIMSRLTVYPPSDFYQHLTKHEKLLEVLEGVFRNQWSNYMAPKDLEHNIEEIMRVVRYNQKIRALMEED